MKASDYIVQYLYSRGVRTVFELSGGMITHILNSLSEFEKIKVISMHHEQSAAFAADAVGRITGVPGIAIATSGPGAINLLSGIASCYFDSTPAVFITGQVPRNELTPSTSSLRQTGFQETNIVAMAASVTKHTFQVRDAKDLPDIIYHAFGMATEGRPGPVLVDIPFDVQASEIGPYELYDFQFKGRTYRDLDPRIFEKIHKGLLSSERPLILAGNGIRAANAINEFRSFVNETKIPVVHSLLAKDVLPYDHQMRVGLIGSYGNRWANHAIAEADFLLVLGSRLDVKQTGSNVEAFTGNKIIYHVDCEEALVNSRVPDCWPVITQLKPFLQEARKNMSYLTPDCLEWRAYLKGLEKIHSDVLELKTEGINPNVFMHKLSEVSKQAGAYVVDTGQHQIWAAQSIELEKDQRFITSGGLGAMGFALPASIGAAIALNKPVVCIVGDGGLQCNIQELQTIVRNNLPIKIVVMNNHCHGLVRQFQESYFNKNYQSTVNGYDAPSFCRIADAYDIRTCEISNPKHVDAGLRELWKYPDSSFILEVEIEQALNVYPKVSFGSPLSEMDRME